MILDRKLSLKIKGSKLILNVILVLLEIYAIIVLGTRILKEAMKSRDGVLL
jgi:hypothetical protein